MILQGKIHIEQEENKHLAPESRQEQFGLFDSNIFHIATLLVLAAQRFFHVSFFLSFEVESYKVILRLLQL